MTIVRKEEIDGAIDFEVSDGLEKLRRMSILVDCDEEDCKQFQVLPLDQALEQAHIKNFDEVRGGRRRRTRSRSISCLILLSTFPLIQAREVVGVRKKKKVPGAPIWQECFDTFPATGQKFR